MIRRMNYFIIVFIITLSNLSFCYINKTFLRYNNNKRRQSVIYASSNWNTINSDYRNYGNAFTEGGITYIDCKGRTTTPKGDECGGDCANFVSQCLITDGINSYELTQSVDPTFVAFNQLQKTVANATELRNRLVNMGAADSISGGITSRNLQPGDVIIVPQGKGYHALIVNQGADNNNDIQVYGHSPTSQAGINPKGFLGHWTGAINARLIHIPDVPMVSSVRVYRRNGTNEVIFYQAAFNDAAGTDGTNE